MTEDLELLLLGDIGVLRGICVALLSGMDSKIRKGKERRQTRVLVNWMVIWWRLLKQ